jgi:hypothetical protein
MGLCGFSKRLLQYVNKINNDEISSFTIMVQDKLVEISTARFLSHVLVDYLRSQQIQRNPVSEGFAARLYCEGDVDVPD